MRLLLVDTHIALWAYAEPGRLRESERTLIGEGRPLLSPVSVWEAAIKREAGRLDVPDDLTTALSEQFEMLSIDAHLLEAAARLPMHHRDPFDRVIIAHALRDDLEILTRDREFERYGVKLAG